MGQVIGCFSSTVARELVHRAAVAEVYVTAIERFAENQFVVNAQWPRKHYFYRTEHGNVDCAILIETFRQATILLAHWGYDVALDSNFLLPDLQLIRFEETSSDPLKPLEVTLRITVTGVTGLPGSVGFLRANADVSSSGLALARVTAGARIVSGTAYARFRGRRKQAPTLMRRLETVSLGAVGAVTASSVLLTHHPIEDTWRLTADLSDPVFFDHSVDHIPGSALIEAARQAIALASGDPTIDFHTLNADFKGMVDLDADIEVRLYRGVSTPDYLSSWTITISTGNRVQASFQALSRTHCKITPPARLESTDSTGLAIYAEGHS